MVSLPLLNKLSEKCFSRLCEGFLAVIASRRRSNLVLWLGINSVISQFTMI
jgi:hypothetical protein